MHTVLCVRHIIGLYLIIVVVAFITHRIVTADSI